MLDKQFRIAELIHSTSLHVFITYALLSNNYDKKI